MTKKEEPVTQHEIVDAEISKVSLVKRGANRTTFAILKAEGGYEKMVPISKTSQEKQVAYGIVYAPGVPDSHGDWASAETIEKMAHGFIRRGLVNAIDTEHDLKENGSRVVESFIARKNDPDFPEGAWVMGVHVADPDLWAMVKSGELTGFSMYGVGERVERPIQKSADPYKIDNRPPDNGEAATGKRVSDRHPLGAPREDLSWLVRKQDLASLERDAARRVAAAKAFQ